MIQILFQAIGTLFAPLNLFYMMIGIIFGLFMGFVPGIGGTFVLIMLLPFAFSMDPSLAIILMISAHAVVVQGGSVSAILLGIPGSPVNAATVIDGYPMAKKGEAGRAIGAALTSSMMGGVVGALILLAIIPIIRPLVLSFGSAEILALAILGICMISLLTGKDPLKGLIAGLMGILFSLIGQDWVTGAMRYTFGVMYLWDGIKLLPFMLGLFAVAEMVELGVVGGTISKAEDFQIKDKPWPGIVDTFKNWWLVVRCSVIGTLVGIIPGLGGDAASFIAYGHAAQTSKTPDKMGTGLVEGVLGPEAANNAKEGGALVPTLAFGIPGSSGMAILLGIFAVLGLTPGRQLLETQLPYVMLLVVTLVFSNIIGSSILMPFIKYMSKITTINVRILAPIVLVITMIGAFNATGQIGDFILCFVFGLIGYFMKKFNYARPAMILGYILGIVMERNMWLSYNVFGIGLLLRPIVFVIILLTVFIIIWSMVITPRRLRKQAAEENNA